MGNYVYVDNSNLWIEGMHVSAVASGMAPDIGTAQTIRIADHSWRMDYGRLREFAGGRGSEVVRAVLYVSPPENDSWWEAARREGFEVVVGARNARNQEKEVDVHLVTDMLFDYFERMTATDEITLVSGDGDFEPRLELEPDALCRHAPDHARDAGFLVLEVEVDVAARVVFDVSEFPAHPHVTIGLLDRALERRGQLRDGHFHKVEAGGFTHGGESLAGGGSHGTPPRPSLTRQKAA